MSRRLSGTGIIKQDTTEVSPHLRMLLAEFALHALKNASNYLLLRCAKQAETP